VTLNLSLTCLISSELLNRASSIHCSRRCSLIQLTTTLIIPILISLIHAIPLLSSSQRNSLLSPHILILSSSSRLRIVHRLLHLRRSGGIRIPMHRGVALCMLRVHCVRVDLVLLHSVRRRLHCHSRILTLIRVVVHRRRRPTVSGHRRVPLL